uniref:Uncharacterized protein n=1 Tax=Marmota marmota marmota TaxID=9994 RepID=A0A8C6A5M9_MARMA
MKPTFVPTTLPGARWISPLTPLTHIQVSCGNTITDSPRNNALGRHSFIQSSRHLKLTITPTITKLTNDIFKWSFILRVLIRQAQKRK